MCTHHTHIPHINNDIDIIMATFQAVFAGGKWSASRADTISVTNPATAESCGTIGAGCSADANTALAAAK